MAVIASVSGLNVAQPDLGIAFGALRSTTLWAINVYTLTLAALLLPLGAIGDRQSRQPMLITDLVASASPARSRVSSRRRRSCSPHACSAAWARR